VDQRIIDLYDAYTHGHLDRRAFMRRLARLVGGAAAAAALMPLLANDYAGAATVAEDDPRLATERVAYDSGKARIHAYLARPSGSSKSPGVLVVHENRGLNPHIEDVARRLAVAGFLAVAPDLLSTLGGTPGDETAARDMQRTLTPEEAIQNLLDGVGFVKAHAAGNGRCGAVGFCWGGGMVNLLAVESPALDAVVSYYGRQPSSDQVPSIAAPLLLHYAGLDTRTNAGIDAFVAALKAGGKDYELYVYEGANHAFNNDTSSRYDKAAAELAWGRTLDFLRRELAG